MIPVLVVLTASGLLFFALVETAFGMLMRLPQRLEVERANENDTLATYLDDPLKFFIPSRLMRGALLVLLIVLLAQPIGVGFTQGLILFGTGLGLSIVVAQVLPSLMVRRSPERYLEILLPAFTVVANALAPFTTLIMSWTGPASSAPRNGETPNSANAAASAEKRASAESGEQSRLLRSVVDFGETLVREVMTPRPDIVALPSDATIHDLRQLVREQEYSRLPVYTENLDNIVGLIVVKDLIQTTTEPDGARPITEIMRPAAFVPETKRVVDLLREFQQGRFQLAIVVDEYGGTAGLVTVEDVVEELVGEIRDEYDSEADPIVREDDDTVVLTGKVSIEELSDRFGVEIEEGDFETVGGFVLAQVGRVPAVGERFQIDGLEIEILEAERRRIHKVRVRRHTPREEVAG
jgi:CBS domain containing-hemolysin-like protein